VRRGQGYDIRWFTPKIEIDLAGHPTLAAAYVIFHYCSHIDNRIVFSSKSGELVVTMDDGLIKMNFPAMQAVPAADSELISRALGKTPSELYRTRDYLAIFDSEDDILSIQPDFELLKKLDCLGVIISAPGKEVDFVSRFFAPAAGIDEDPVTGSAHSTLVPYWARRLKKDLLHAFQLSKRGGELFCQYMGDRVMISGRAVPYLKGTISI
jgi:PhzF family phenazine biosynthesis protein